MKILSVLSFLLLTSFISMSFAPVEINEITTEVSETPTDIQAELDDFMCNLTFTYNQVYSCCNTSTSGCACVDISVPGIYNFPCASTVTDIWFESIFLCSQNPWSGVSPTIRIYVDLYQACPSSCSYVNIPITMKYNYNCGFGTCTGSYNKTIRMLLC